MQKILVSGCLLGWNCRYDAAACTCLEPVFLKWREEGRLIAVCPETAGGLCTPRMPCERAGANVIAADGSDRTEEFSAGARAALRLALEHGAAFCVLKENSPSCGSHRIYDGTFSGRKIDGQGVTAQLLRESGFEVFSENEIAEAAEYLRLKENS